MKCTAMAPESLSEKFTEWKGEKPVASDLYSSDASVGQSDESKRKPQKTKHDHDRGKHIAGSSSKRLKPHSPYSQRRYKTKKVKKLKSMTKKKDCRIDCTYIHIYILTSRKYKICSIYSKSKKHRHHEWFVSTVFFFNLMCNKSFLIFKPIDIYSTGHL